MGDNSRPGARVGPERERLADETSEKMRMFGLKSGAGVLAAAERQLRDGGVGVDIDVQGLSRLWTSVDFYLDLGVLQGDKRRKRLSPGRKSLVESNKLASLQTRIRTNLYNHSFVIGLLGSYRYVPDDAFMTWHGKHEALVGEFNQVRDDYIERYDELVAALQEDYRDMATETWEALVARGDDDEKSFTEEYTLPEFQDAVVAKAMTKLPSPEEMEEEIKVVVKVATWMLGVEAAQDQLSRERLLGEAQVEREERDHWLQEDRAHSKAMEAKWNAQQEEAMVKTVEAQEAQRLIEVEADAKAKAIKAAQLELARKSVQEMTNPLDEMLNSLRDQMYKTTAQVADNVSKNGRVVGKQVQAITNMIATFRMLNAAGDDELESQINSLELAMDKPGLVTTRDTGAILTALNSVAGVAITKAESLVDLTSWDEFDALDL